MTKVRILNVSVLMDAINNFCKRMFDGWVPSYSRTNDVIFTVNVGKFHTIYCELPDKYINIQNTSGDWKINEFQTVSDESVRCLTIAQFIAATISGE